MVATASVAKLFIADELLLQESQGKATLSADERHTLDAMLQSSDDDAAEKFWNQAGGETIIRDVAARYGLAATQPPSDGRWWDTTTSTRT
ncbi:putative lipoprotein lppW [Mycobacterium xenopi 4042]|uniref:Putative lipoprotein lppW n=1 Tax=Mycobacterium xenopi 4042 TaxID=1299334 RepID=X8E891_MYCXE|nr:putative lipoprotein lppW [Mycobacterium xenopi 4042]